MRIPLVGESMLGVEVAVVGREDDQGLVQHALLRQLGNDPAAGGVHLGGKAVVILHVLLITLGGVEPPVPAVAAFVLLIGEEWRQLLEMGVRGGFWNGDAHVLMRDALSGCGRYCFGFASSAWVAKKASVRQKGLSAGRSRRNSSASFSFFLVT